MPSCAMSLECALSTLLFLSSCSDSGCIIFFKNWVAKHGEQEHNMLPYKICLFWELFIMRMDADLFIQLSDSVLNPLLAREFGQSGCK